MGSRPGALAQSEGKIGRRMSLSRFVASSLFLALCAGAGPPRAQTASCQPGQGSLAVLSCRIAEQLGAAARGASVTVLDLKSDRPLPNQEALRERLQSALALALRAGTEPGAAARSKLRVELSVEKIGGVLRVGADVRRALGLWQRLRHDKPRSEAHAFAEVALDAELRALIPPPPLVVSETLRLKAPERGIVAVACGPLAPDGGQELALVSRSFVRVGRVQGRAFVERARAPWSALSPVAPAPLREPLASAEITAAGTLRVGSSDRRDGLTLSRDLSVSERYEGLLPVPGAACAARSGLGLAAQLSACSPRAGAAAASNPTLDALSGSAGSWLGRALETGNLVSGAGALSAPATRVGAQLALGDADSDGAPELAYSADTLQADKDRLTVVTLMGNKVVPRFELPVPGISALAICQRREGPGMAPLVVATNDELWLLR
jgi:hypothetical protein